MINKIDKSIYTIMKTILFALLLVVSNSSFSGGAAELFKPKNTQPERSTKIGPFSINQKYCRQIQQISAILNSYSNVQWPAAGAGFSFGIVQNESVVLKLCDFLIKLESLDTEGMIRAGGMLLNEMTNKKWNHHFQQADLLWNTGNSFYDFRGGGGFRQGALTSASGHARLLSFSSKSKKYFNGGKMDGKGDTIETRAERRQELMTLQRNAHQRAILKEASACPKPTGNKNYQKDYQTKVLPLEQKKKD